MPRQQVEFEFPDPDKEEDTTEFEVDDAENREFIFEKDKEAHESKKKGKEVEAEDTDDVELEIIDDTPPEDRGRKASAPPEDPTEDELENYSDKVRQRIKHFTKGYHDERRAKETALREREELEAFAKKVLEENQQLKGTVDKNQNTMLEQAKQTVARELEAAKRQYKEAYESGDSDAIVEAQDAIATARIRADKVANFKPAPLQQEETPVQVPQTAREQPKSQVDQRASTWAEENSWFGSDDEMTAFALGLHNKLVKEGVDPQSDTYYEHINTRMRKVFPEEFNESEDASTEAAAPKKRASNVVAPATRSTAPKKVTLTRTQVSLAKRLGLPLEVYAQQVAKEMRKG
jgi:hypothetical protein